MFDKLLRRAGQTKRRDLAWVTEDVAVSRAPNSSDWPYLVEAGVKNVLDLRAEGPDQTALARSLELTYRRFPIEEGSAPDGDSLNELSDWVVETIQQGGPVLIFCREGRGRSVMVACGALTRLGYSLQMAYEVVQRKRPSAACPVRSLACASGWSTLPRLRFDLVHQSETMSICAQ